MKKFLLKVLLFGGIPLMLAFIGFLLPATPRAKHSFLFAKRQKDSLLQHVPGPRLVLVGGSNVSMGINSAAIHDSLGLRPVNTAIVILLGLKYIMDNAVKGVKQGDIVLLIPEYQMYYGFNAYGCEELLRMVTEVAPEDYAMLNVRQKISMSAFLPMLGYSRLMPSEYFNYKLNEVYCDTSFNTYGDGYIHWGMKRQKFSSQSRVIGWENKDIIQQMLLFKKQVEEKGATLLVSFPCYQDISFDRSADRFAQLPSYLQKEGFTVIGTPERYRMADSLCFDSPYHLVKEGVDYRTALLIGDIRGWMEKNNLASK